LKPELNFKSCSPEEKGLDTSLLEELRAKLNHNEIRGCLVLRKGGIVFDYYQTEDIKASRQKINSCTKSILSALFGAALNKGLVRDIDIPAAEYFREYPVWADERKKRITLRHLLTMTSGLSWDEAGERLFIRARDNEGDVIKYILSREMVNEPGTSMKYNSGCSQLLSAVIQKAAGLKTSAFAHEVLFKPLGITEFSWQEKQGVSIGGTGIELTHLDMLKFGYLFLSGGYMGGQRIISEDWVRRSTAPHVFTNSEKLGYGYHWWCASTGGPDAELAFFYAMGFGGQLIIVLPEVDMVVVFTGRTRKDPFLPMRLFLEYILKAVKPPPSG
jgi:CubicO group peptidase (beta-lactamase class C family)